MSRKKKVKSVNLIQLFNEFTPVVDLTNEVIMDKVRVEDEFEYDIKSWKEFKPEEIYPIKRNVCKGKEFINFFLCKDEIGELQNEEENNDVIAI